MRRGILLFSGLLLLVLNFAVIAEGVNLTDAQQNELATKMTKAGFNNVKCCSSVTMSSGGESFSIMILGTPITQSTSLIIKKKVESFLIDKGISQFSFFVLYYQTENGLASAKLDLDLTKNQQAPPSAKQNSTKKK